MHQRLDGKSKGVLAGIARELIDKYKLPPMDRLERRTAEGMITWYAKHVTRDPGAWADMVAWILKEGGSTEALDDLLRDGPIGLGVFAPQRAPASGENEDPATSDLFGLGFP
jgi:hypothetical protein